MATISTTTVIGAMYQLKTAYGRWASAQEIADYLEVDRRVIAPLLAGLRDRRVFRDRQRDGRKVWMPWEAT
jgi:hypothetical protein